MNILNLYFSSTGNTEKVALRIEKTIRDLGERVDTWKFRDERPEDEEIRRYGSAAVATGATGAADLDFHDHQLVIEDMVAAIETGRAPMISLASVRPTLEWALAMYKSAKRNAPVELPLAGEESVW